MMKVFWNRQSKWNHVISLTTAFSLLISLHVIAQKKGGSTAPTSKKQTPTIIKSTPQPLKPKVVKVVPPAKTEPEEEGGLIRIISNLVAIPVSVTDSAGQPIRNLGKDDFRIEEEGQSQPIEFLGEPGKTPVDLALLFDVSASVHERFQFEQQAVSRFLKSVFRPTDAASVFSVGQVPKQVVVRTSNLAQVMSGAMTLIPTREGTALFDTVVQATHYLKETASPGTRRVIIVISDGEDNNSERYNLAQSLRELQQTDCLFYSINPSGPSIWLNKISQRGQSDMMAMATITGGYAFVPEKIEDLETVFHQIGTELQAQYLIGYYPTEEKNDGRFRRIAVKVPKRPELRIRARQGYYAPKA